MDNKKLPRFMHNSIATATNKHINLLHVGWESCMPNYTFVNHRNMYLIHYIKEGSGFLQIENIKYHLGPGDIFLIRPEQMASYTASTENPWQYFYFAFDGDVAEEILSKTYFANNNVCFTLQNDELSEHIQNAVYELDSQHNNDFLSLEYLFKFFHCIKSVTTTVNEKVVKEKNHYITALEEYIMFNYSKNLSVLELAKMVNLNRSHLHRIFKEQTGKSIEEYIIYVRIQEAKRFLRETELAVTTISGFVGYNNYPSFFRMFKNLEKITPTEYRELHKNEQ